MAAWRRKKRCFKTCRAAFISQIPQLHNAQRRANECLEMILIDSSSFLFCLFSHPCALRRRSLGKALSLKIRTFFRSKDLD